MHTASKSFTLMRIQARSERGKRLAKARWDMDRARRQAEIDPMFNPSQIIRRIIVIDKETCVREAIIYKHDSARSARAKIKRVLSSLARIKPEILGAFQPG